MTIKDIFQQDKECKRLIDKLHELKNKCNEDPYETEIGYSTLEDLEDCITNFRTYMALIGDLDVYSIISDRLGRKE